MEEKIAHKIFIGRRPKLDVGEGFGKLIYIEVYALSGWELEKGVGTIISILVI